MINIMEHKQLREKLKSMDLGQVNGLQWDQDRVWSRLNGQLQLVNQKKKKALWFYPMAACIVFLILFVSNYILLKDSKEFKSETSLNKEQLSVNNFAIVQETQCREQASAKENKVTTPKNNRIVLIEKPVEKNLGKKNIHAPIIETTTTLQVTDLNNKILASQANKPIIKELVEDPNLLKDIAYTDSLITSRVLDSTPLKLKKNKFSIKLFKRKNKPKYSSNDASPALILFASK